MSIVSSQSQLERMQKVLSNYLRLPFSDQTIPGTIMEHVLAFVRDAEVLNTYDFVDVIDKKNRLGWQVKSTKNTTPVTWKRAKIANAADLINASFNSEKALQELGDAIIDFCNSHAVESMERYDLDSIGYARLVVFPEKVIYFERTLCTRDNQKVFVENQYKWHWSSPKKTTKKEQLKALHGIDVTTGKKAWAWHGLGENQLHFSGESVWWPQDHDAKAATFKLPSEAEKLSLEDFIKLLETSDS